MLTPALLLMLAAEPAVTDTGFRRGAAGWGLVLEAGAGVEESMVGDATRAGLRIRAGLSKDFAEHFAVGAAFRLTRGTHAEASLAVAMWGRIQPAERLFLALGLGARGGFFTTPFTGPYAGDGFGFAPDLAVAAEYWVFRALLVKLTVTYALVPFQPLQHRFEQVLSLGVAL